MVQEVSFKVDGGFITDLARTWFWDENRPYETVEELLLSCLVTDSISLQQRKDIALSIIEGRKKLVGINQFDLVDDNVKVRPLYEKINELKKIAIIKEIEDDIVVNPLMYVDVYSTVKSYKGYLRTIDEDIEENYTYESYDNVVGWFSTYSGVIGSTEVKEFSKETKAGLWLFEKPKLIYDLIQGKITNHNRDEFFEKLYKHIGNEDLSAEMKKRQTHYERVINYNKNATKPINYLTKDTYCYESADKLPPYNEEDYRFSETRLDWYVKPDKFISEYSWINKYGDWYSCEFGGHQTKAESIVCCNESLKKKYRKWLEENGERYESKLGDYTYTKWRVKLLDCNYYVNGSEMYTEFLLRTGWVKFHNPIGGECKPTYYKKPTKEQNEAMFKASIFFNYNKVQGLED